MRVYRYWCEPCSQADADLLGGQIKLARDYKRALADRENAARVARRALDLATPEVAALQAQIDAFVAQPSQERDRAAYTAVKRRLKVVRDERKVDPVFRAAADALHADDRAQARVCRSTATAAGLYWGTYLLVEDAHDRSVRTTAVWDEVRANPGRWDSIGVQIQSTRPLATEAVVGGDDTRFRIGTETYATGFRVDGYRRAEGCDPCEIGLRSRLRRPADVVTPAGSD